MVETYDERTKTFIILLLFLNLKDCHAIGVLKDTNELVPWDGPETLVSDPHNYTHQKVIHQHVIPGFVKGISHSGYRRNRSKNEIVFNETKHLEDKWLKRRLNKLLHLIEEAPRKEQKLRTVGKDVGAVRPMIRHAERDQKPQKIDLDALLEVIFRRIEKAKRKKVALNMEEKKSNMWRAGWQLPKTTTIESYERRRLKDFFSILCQLNDMGISIKQMDHLSKQPMEYKRFVDSLDERQAASRLEKMMEEDPKLSGDSAQDDLELVRGLLSENGSPEVRRGLARLLCTINELY